MPRTSLSHPLRIPSVPVPGTPGILGLTLCPGKVQEDGLTGAWQRDLDLDLRAVRDWGACALVTLMEGRELAACRVADLPARLPAGIAHFHLPIPDGGVPDAAWERAWAVAGPRIRTLLREGGKVVVHCLGGLGRTGTIAARLLVEFGMTPEAAIQAVRAARPGAIETAGQEAYVRRQRPAVPGGLEPDAPGADRPGPVGMPPSVRPYHRITPDRASRFRGCLLAGAVGDALGAPVEFMDLAAIHRTFGPAGIRDLAPAHGRLGAITDDTQMTLFTADGLLRWHLAGAERCGPGPAGFLAQAYQRWRVTQGVKGRTGEVPVDGWLGGHRELFAARAPGNTCLSALAAREDPADGRPAANDSKGCGGVMRVAPIGLYVAARGLPPGTAFAWGCAAAALTHGHPTGQLAAGAMALLVCQLALGHGLRTALVDARSALDGREGARETLVALDRAEQLAAVVEDPAQALARLGQGWVAEEALAIAVFCALQARSLEEGLVLAVNLTGDSDSTGAMAGALLGAMLGVHELPGRWLEPLELREVLVDVADDLATVEAWPRTGPGHDTLGDRVELAWWHARYPGPLV
jgi:ADP-ribosylglycohydrolase